jgi:acetyl esterase/lipase
MISNKVGSTVHFKSYKLKITSVLFIVGILFFVYSTSPLPAQDFTYPPDMGDGEVRVYKTVQDIELRLWIYKPNDHKSSDARPAIVFFFGGGWQAGSPMQFKPHAEYLASRGMVAISAEYRVRSRHGVSVSSCVADAQSAIQWVRIQAKDLGIDPARIIASGGSAGGHLAASTATLELPSSQRTVSSEPNALILFNPAVILAPVDGLHPKHLQPLENYKDRFDVRMNSLSPFHHLASNVGPTLIFHGMSDELVPFATVELFTQKMRELGNRCELIGYPDARHGFFNYGRHNNIYFVDTIQRIDDFLVSLGYLDPLPKAKEF